MTRPASSTRTPPARHNRPQAAAGHRQSAVLSWLHRLITSRRFQQNLLMFLLMLFLGVILMNHIVKVRAEQKSNNLLTSYKQRLEDLKHYEERYAALLAENDELNKQKAAAIADLLNSQGNEKLMADLERMRILAGFTEVKGPGVTLVLDDKPEIDYLLDLPESIVHDSDIRHALDLFRAAGAAAFSINGLRYTNASNVYCIGSTIRCNQSRLAPPYVIVALGDPDKLAEAILADQDFNYRQSPEIGLVVNVEKESAVIIPAFAEADDVSRYIDLLEVVKP